MAELINKVAESGIITLDLSELVPQNQSVSLDISTFLFEGYLLREKEFRAKLSETDWSIYSDKWVGIYCSTDAIIQKWAWMLLFKHLHPFTSHVVYSDPEKLPEKILMEQISRLSIAEFTDARVVIKGCGEKFVTDEAYLHITRKLTPVVKSLMYGEPCSTVPVYKKK